MLKSVLLPQLNSIVKRRIIDLHVADRTAERREFPRYAVALGVTCQTLNEQYEPIGEPFEAVTRDISEGGVGLLNNRPIEPGLLAVTFADRHGDLIEMHVQISRCKPQGELYLAAGPFVDGPYPVF